MADAASFLRACPPGSTVAVLGAPGTGKSRSVQQADAAGVFPRRVVFDPYARTSIAALERGAVAFPWPGRVVSPGELASEPELLDDPRLRLVVAPGDLAPRALGRDFAFVADLAWHTGGVDVIAEEAGLYSRDAISMLMRLSSGGRHVGSRLVLICQSLSRLALDARRHLSAAIVHAQGEPQDIDELRKRCGKAFAAKVQSLKVGDSPLFWRQGDALEA